MLGIKLFGGKKDRQGKDRRQYVRHTGSSLTVLVDGQKYKTIDWSLGGFRIKDFHRAVSPNERLQGEVSPPKGISGEFIAEIVWVSDEGHLGLKFLEIAPRTFLSMTDIKAC